MDVESVPPARYVDSVLTMEDFFFDPKFPELLTLSMQFILRDQGDFLEVQATFGEEEAVTLRSVAHCVV